MSRRTYVVSLNINGRALTTVVIDPHYEENHFSSITDAIILCLVKELDGQTFKPTTVDTEGFEYYVNDRIKHNDKLYKPIWLLHEEELFVGIINAYRR